MKSYYFFNKGIRVDSTVAENLEQAIERIKKANSNIDCDFCVVFDMTTGEYTTEHTKFFVYTKYSKENLAKQKEERIRARNIARAKKMR